MHGPCMESRIHPSLQHRIVTITYCKQRNKDLFRFGTLGAITSEHKGHGTPSFQKEASPAKLNNL